jgi:carboxylesterase type B
MSQRYFHCAMAESIRLQKKIAPVYSYFYNYKLSFGFGELLSQSNVNLGVSHGEDIMLLYSTPVHSPPFVYSDEEKLMSENLLDMYATFARKG